MKSPAQKAPENRQKFSNGTFAAVTFAAVIIAVVLISIGRVSSAIPAVSIPPTTPTTESSATPTIPTPTPPIDTETPSPQPAFFDTTKGSPEAPITIIEFSDFQCAHCQQFALTVERELDKLYVETGKVRFIYKFMIGYGEESLLANVAAACAAEQGQFWPYYYLLMQQRASPKKDDITVELLQFIALQIGLNIDQFNASLLSGKHEAKVRQDDADGRALGVTSTPIFFINGIKKEGAKSLQDLQEIIDPMLESLTE